MNENFSQELSALRTQMSLLESRLQRATDDAESAIFNSPRQAMNEASVHPPYYPSNEVVISASFWPTINDAGTGITIEEGDVVLGPMTWVEWASITSATTTPAVSSTDTHVWLEVNVVANTAIMVVGTKAAMMAALTSTEDDTIMVYPLIGTTWASGKITKAKRLLDAIIPRAAN
jgi:hypothetical protein